ncbi:hypothetical protein [Pseudogemmobacter sonorensis]|uniref:hypothetical protein n=1 Tax=Pseudogemmobacter sonorensis TaxID=2989681 RepID=UPI0036CB0D63
MPSGAEHPAQAAAARLAGQFEVIGARQPGLPATVILMAMAIAIALLPGLVSGTVMALSAGRWPDRLLSIVSLLFCSVPTFWIGLMLIFFSVRLGWLPP